MTAVKQCWLIVLSKVALSSVQSLIYVCRVLFFMCGSLIPYLWILTPFLIRWSTSVWALFCMSFVEACGLIVRVVLLQQLRWQHSRRFWQQRDILMVASSRQ